LLFVITFTNMKLLCLISCFIFLISCKTPERNCQDYRNGTFEFTAIINGEEKTTSFTRNEAIEIDIFEGVKDSSSVKWINDCEYILKNLHPKNALQKAPIAIKILTTNQEGYTFEYGQVGDSNKARGTVKKIN
jgi:hypothetical protein